MRIRKGKSTDIDVLVAQGREFWKSTRYVGEGHEYKPEVVANLCEWLMNEGGFIVVLEDDDEVVRGHGLVALAPLIFDPDISCAMEFAFYVEPEYRRGKWGLALLKAMETTAAGMGVQYMTMVTMESSMPRQVETIYNRMGYERTETSYTKELK